MPLVESYNGSVDLFLVSCISLSYAAGRVLQRFSGFFLVSCVRVSRIALVEFYNGSVDLFLASQTSLDSNHFRFLVL